ncbi:phospholipase [Actinoalloteichus caeruleus]|uniref:Phospholipase A2 n=1 Tax=Actinoalloteichus caeruleus DSM 43889 TaxID=1120930 RepID=A0ABT1JQK2_ACTCY|nr:phospholipase [Actinoalloteichus caeruleus]MCP2334454.1 phospholipase A2 [Actinoalloteichus caeruleus DSM 43889]
MSSRSPRRALRTLIASVLATMALLVGGGVAHASLPPAELRQVTDDYLFTQSLPLFVQLRSQRPHAPQLDWSSDGCSYSPDEPFGYEFLNSCHRHDFGYRNYKLQNRFTSANRKAIDDRFRDDMYSVCSSAVCRRTADVYYWAVRAFGGSGTTTAEAIERALHEPSVQARLAELGSR